MNQTRISKGSHGIIRYIKNWGYDFPLSTIMLTKAPQGHGYYFCHFTNEGKKGQLDVSPHMFMFFLIGKH